MKFLEEYKWNKNEDDGTYNIYNVPVFSFFKDEKRGTVGHIEAGKITKNFNKFTEGGHYPRVFIGHHNFVSPDRMTENKPGAGFMDNLVVKNGLFFCDFKLVPQHVFDDIQKNRFPYRSAEYDPTTFQIKGVALLESQDPYFKFPMLKLAKGTLSFCSDSIILFQKENNMPVDNEQKEENIAADIIKENNESNKFSSDGVDTPEHVDEEMSQLDKLSQKLDKLIELMTTMAEGKKEKMEASENKEIDPPDSSSVAYQALLARVDAMEKNKNLDVLTFQLQNLCKEKSLNFEQQSAIFKNFSDDAGRQHYLKVIKDVVAVNPMPVHPMTAMAQEGVKLFQSSIDALKGVKGKYASTKDEAAANKAIEIYQAVMKSGNEERIKILKSISKDLDSFVSSSVLAYNSDPNYFLNFTMGV